MLALNSFLLNIYLFIVVESFSEISSDQINNKLLATMHHILCSTDSTTIHLAADRENVDDLDELIERLNRDCPFKTIQISAIEMTQTRLQYHSEVTVFMINSEKSIHLFQQATTRYQGSHSHHRFLVVFQFKFDLTMLVNSFKKLTQKTNFNIIVLMHDELGISTLMYNSFDETFISINETAVTTEAEIMKDVFVRNRSNLRGRKLVVSMYEQNDRALNKKNNTRGYTGVDGLIAELLEEGYLNWKLGS